ncbi:DUF397 domain-containing protein [Actinomadura decatromicini]|uniref:DUF397 domain-containing protein n=1 Tax=Actinomadura decatromicini TaxID=2604572 RepID=A0A5D3FYJ7_9ACTN|nr:DUF397 domain-containing protein [Actinomadura decatromicini]TYK52810.1 DUF397 domain-containing protein [Actinomadura decatromicini]
MRPRPTKSIWRTSSHSGGTGNCVEVASLIAGIGVRDSKAPGTGHLSFSAKAWAAFVAKIRDGHLDLS